MIPYTKAGGSAEEVDPGAITKNAMISHGTMPTMHPKTNGSHPPPGCS